MFKKKNLFAGMLGVLLVFSLFFMGCPTDDGGSTTGGQTQGGPARPVITLHPTSADYSVGATPRELAVDARVSDEGTLSYQWYEVSSFVNTGGSQIGGQTGKTFSPPAAAGTKYYYALVTNKRGERTGTQASHPARIKISDDAASSQAVNINVVSTKNQYIRGFGGMSNAFGITAGARYMELRDIDTMFNPDGQLGFNILRICLWPFDLADIVSGAVMPEMNNQIYYEIVKRVNRHGGYVLASPWTPPSYMKANQSNVGTQPSHVLPEYYGDYANYLKNFCQTMANNGAPIYAVSIQNETTFASSYDGCWWEDYQQRNFYRDNGKFTDGVPGYGGGQELPRVLRMSGEPHQNVTWNDLALDDAGARANIDIVSYHTYGRMDNAYPKAQNMGKEVWMTEKNINSGGGLEVQDSSWNFVWLFAEDIDYTIRRNSTNAYVWWYAKRYYSMIADGVFGTVNGAITPRGYVMGHWSKFATDTVRINAAITGHPGNLTSTGQPATEDASNVRVSAFIREADSAIPEVARHNEDSISVLVYDRRTGSASPSDIKINLPANFEAANAYAVFSDANNKHAPALVVLAEDGKSAVVTLNGNSIMSVKFTK